MTGPYCFEGWCSENAGPPSIDLTGISFTSPTNGYAIGFMPGYALSGVFRWNGTTWSQEQTPPLLSARALVTAGTHVFVAGVGAILHFDGATWTRLIVPGTWVAGSGTATNDVWFVGTGGSVTHWDGAQFSPSSSGTSSDLNAVVAFAPDRVYVGGSNGVLRLFQGLGWGGVTTNSTVTIRTMIASGSDVLLFGNQSALRVSSTGTVTPLAGLTMTAPTAAIETALGLWLFGTGNAQGALWNGSQWLSITVPTLRSPAAVASSEPGRIWLVGGRAQMVVGEGAMFREVLSDIVTVNETLSLHDTSNGLAALATTAAFTRQSDGGWVPNSLISTHFARIPSNARDFCLRDDHTFLYVDSVGNVITTVDAGVEGSGVQWRVVVCGAGMTFFYASAGGGSYYDYPGGFLVLGSALYSAIRRSDGGVTAIGEQMPNGTAFFWRNPIDAPMSTLGPSINTMSGQRVIDGAETSDGFLVTNFVMPVIGSHVARITWVPDTGAASPTLVTTMPKSGYYRLDTPSHDLLFTHGADSITRAYRDGGVSLEPVPGAAYALKCSRATRQCWISGERGSIWRKQF